MAHLVLDQVSVDFPVFGANRNLRLSVLSGMTGGRILPKRLSTQPVVVKALENICLEFKRGDRVALLGHNGAGKTTLLRVMAGVYYPTAGRLMVEGRLTPLLNLTPGIEHEDTGYENIITIGMLIGMTLKEVMAKIPGIIEFSELGDYIQLPVRTYSSGMRARLGFAIATALDPGILLLDEDFGTVDARFGEKASRRVNELVEKTDILVLASHLESLVASMCNKAVLMHHGKVLEFGPVGPVKSAYERIRESG